MDSGVFVPCYILASVLSRIFLEVEVNDISHETRNLETE